MTSMRAPSAWAFIAPLLCMPAPALAGPPDPLIVTQMADPDPGFVPPKPEKHAPRVTHRNDDENPTIDQAFENLGRVTGALEQKMRAQYQPSEADLKAAQERLRQRLEESSERLKAARDTAGNPGN